MKIEDFQKHSHELVDWMFSYLKEIEKYPIKPDIKPGEIYNALPKKPPMNGEAFDKIFKDFNEIIIPGITHWQSPNFHAFFPANNSYPSILAEMLISTIGAQCMMWDTSPSATELEQKVTEWIRDSIGLPSNWSGVINDTASVGTICSLLTARENHSKFKINSDGFSNNKYKIYCSKETHSSIEKAVKIIGFGSKNLNKIDTNNNLNKNKMFDWKKPTVQMLGRWQPWHDGHQALFKRCVAKTGQVVIQVRDVQGASGGDGQDDNPFDWDVVCKNIEEGLIKDNYKRGVDYEIMLVPNIVNITYGRGVGYAFDEEVFDDATQSISATKIRKKMRDEGKLK